MNRMNVFFLFDNRLFKLMTWLNLSYLFSRKIYNDNDMANYKNIILSLRTDLEIFAIMCLKNYTNIL
jgi:hypothetical protein